jgi:hypothetical protein
MLSGLPDLIPNAKFVSLPDLDHIGALPHKEKILHHIQGFFEVIS